MTVPRLRADAATLLEDERMGFTPTGRQDRFPADSALSILEMERTP